MNFVDKMLEKIDKQNVLNLWGDGCTAEEIAEQMNISVKWVEQVICNYEAKQLNIGDFAEIK